MKYNTEKERILKLLIILEPIVLLPPTEVKELIFETGAPLTETLYSHWQESRLHNFII